MNRIVKIVFSPTGGTAKVTSILAEAFALPSVFVDLTNAGIDFSDITVSADDLCIIAVPVYGGRAPAPAIEHLSAIRGNGAKAILVAVYGNRDFDDVLAELQDTVTAAGFIPTAGISAVSEHSILRQYGAGRPDKKDTAQLIDFAQKILLKLE